MSFVKSIHACAAAGALALSLAVPAMAEETELPSLAGSQGGALSQAAQAGATATFVRAFNNPAAVAPANQSVTALAESGGPGASYASGVLADTAQSLPPPGAPPASGLPDMRPEWHGDAPAAPPPSQQVDPRARAAWLSECRHRLDYYYDDGDRHGRKHWRDTGYDYCEAYLDDYFRYASQAGYSGYGYAQPGYGHMMMGPRMGMVVTRPATPPHCEEVVSERYVPERVRVIPRRPYHRPPVHDKRIKLY